jgi:hypothetical protein
VLLAGAHRIAEDPFGANLVSVAAFERFIGGNHQWHARDHKGCDQQGQQDTTDQQPRPLDAIEHAMIALKLALVAQAHHAQNGGDGASTRCQNRTHHQDLHPFPRPFGERLRKRSQHRYHGIWQDKHSDAPLICCVQRILSFLFCLPNG